MSNHLSIKAWIRNHQFELIINNTSGKKKNMISQPNGNQLEYSHMYWFRNQIYVYITNTQFIILPNVSIEEFKLFKSFLGAYSCNTC